MKWLLNVANRSRNADIGFETPRCRKVSEDQLSGIKIMRMEIGHHLHPPCWTNAQAAHLEANENIRCRKDIP
ncbi:MAG: hypothetical protein CR217_17540 [Beijerinckiaceae bacterium]|jgi:hypothetical protein|nr:MAG: hypothetical protein CR217_17540 [Beijerinckiaceae bacterium]